MNKGFYSANEITDEFSTKYGIDLPTEDARRALRQKITRSLKSIGLWNKGIDDRHGKKKERLFTSTQVIELEMRLPSGARGFESLRLRALEEF